MTKFSNTVTCKKHGKKKNISNKLSDLAKEISRENVKSCFPLAAYRNI